MTCGYHIAVTNFERWVL